MPILEIFLRNISQNSYINCLNILKDTSITHTVGDAGGDKTKNDVRKGRKRV